MALMRYVGPYPEVRVLVAGNEIGTVEKDGSIVVPDELADQVSWSEHWEAVKGKSKETKAVKADEKAKDDALSAPASTAEAEDVSPGVSDADTNMTEENNGKDDS